MTEVQLYNYNMGTGVAAFSTTRQGGCSTGQSATEGDACQKSKNYESFNINCYCGDSEEHVVCNREALCQQLGISDDRLIMPHQTHDTRVACIDEDFLSMTMAERQAALDGIDALMTNVPGVCIGVRTADCIPLLLHDPRRHAACAIHAGWRGTVARIAEKAVRAMAETYGTQPSDLVAQIGPGISLDSFEVGQEVYDAFAAAGFDMSTISKRYPVNDSDSRSGFVSLLPEEREKSFMLHSSLLTTKWHIDLPECNRRQLIASGLRADRITLSGICTYKACDTFFSARRLGINSGRIFTGILLKAPSDTYNHS